MILIMLPLAQNSAHEENIIVGELISMILLRPTWISYRCNHNAGENIFVKFTSRVRSKFVR